MNFTRFIIFLSFLFLFLNTSISQVVNNQTIKLWRAFDIISNYYVDTINQNQLVEKAIVEMVKNLDPHSSYLTEKEVKEMNEPLQGNFEGIGVSFNILNDTIYVISPISGGPSEKAGILAGDRIVKVDGKNVAGIRITNKDVFGYLRGKKGTKVLLGIRRRGVEGLIDFQIIRDKIPIYSVDAWYRIDDIGYIKIARFASTTSKEFDEALVKMSKEGPLSGIIVDLTSNGGGYLEEAVNLAENFLSNGSVVVYTQGLNSQRLEYKAGENGRFKKGNVVVMIDEGSASASEILSGAIQDHDRGIVVGRRSFGKGLVQRPFYLNDGSMLRLTVARYYTPSGRCIQKEYKLGDQDYNEDLIDRYQSGELSNKDSIRFNESLKTFTLNKKRIIYGGGGIMPDIFVGIDTLGYSDFYRDIIRLGILNRFVLNFVDQHRKEFFADYPDFNTFEKKFQVHDSIYGQLVDLAKSDSIQADPLQVKQSKETITNLIKANIARDLWTGNEFYKIYNNDDPIYRKALMVIKEYDQFSKSLKIK